MTRERWDRSARAFGTELRSAAQLTLSRFAAFGLVGGQFVDHMQDGSGEGRARPVEFVEQPRDCGVACFAEDTHLQDAVLRLGDDFGVRLRG